MRKLRYILAIGLSVAGMAVQAQQKDYNGQIGARLNIFEQKDDSLYIQIQYDLTDFDLSSRRSVSLAPILQGSNDSLRLPAIEIKGNNNYKSYKRQRALQKNRSTNQLAKYLVLKSSALEGDRIAKYELTIPYEKWMKSASIRVSENITGCGCLLASADLKSFDQQLKMEYSIADFKPYYQEDASSDNYCFVGSELAKMDEVSAFVHALPAGSNVNDTNFNINDVDNLRKNGALTIYFKAGSSVIDYSIPQNKQVLESVRKMVNLIKNDPHAELSQIVIAGASSPEGTPLMNEKLSAARAQALISYLGDDVTPKVFKTHVIGEDWTLLREMINNSSMPEKKEVLDIIDRVPVMKGREGLLMRLHGGATYRYMMKEFFPRLRSAGYIQIFYDIKPDSEFSSLQKVIGLVKNGDYEEALLVLKQLRETAQVQNLLGICYLKTGKEREGYFYLQESANRSYEYAQKNLDTFKTLFE